MDGRDGICVNVGGSGDEDMTDFGKMSQKERGQQRMSGWRGGRGGKC